jgi:succinoglycan biosynthesis protein ExoA
MTRSFVSILVPTLNEDRHIERMIRSIVPNSDEFDFELVVLDGGSRDRTVELVENLGRDDPRIRIVPNPKRLQAAAVNLGARIADPRAEIIVRADSHAVYPERFIQECVRALRDQNAQSVVVTMTTAGSSWFQRGAAAAQNSLLGNGGSAHRRPGRSRIVDHGHHAAFDRAFFLKLGGYDEAIAANEDVDLDMRVARAGGRIWLETSVPVTYFPRDTAWALARQYFRYGRGRALTWRRHGYRLRLRQLLPVAILGGNLGACLLAVVAGPLALAIPALYGLACFGWGCAAAVANRDPSLAVTMGAAAAIMHHAWAAGFLTGLAETLRRGAR